MAEQIIINLDEERDAYVVSRPEDIIHINEFARIRDLLKDSLEAAKKFAMSKSYDGNSKVRTNNCRDKNDRYRSELLPVRRHDTIMLAGVRGSGKTTFMLSILDFIEKGKIGINFDGNSNQECEIESLHILDPTLIEDKTHIFINIISMIKDKVDVTAKNSNCFKNEECELSRKYKDWEKSFRKLAEGLPSIGGLGADGFNTDSWLDAEFVMNTGVRRAHAAYKLEESFREYVRCSLEFIDKKAFILCFDDIDTNFGKGWPVLEVLHKYLTTPQMITVLSGDPSLYSILIRDQQWSNFSDRLLQMEGRTKEGRQQFKETVAHLEEQYFLKLLKPERRVFLNSLYQKEQLIPKEKRKGAITVNINNLTKSLRDSYVELIEQFGIYGSGLQETFYRFLASTPLRTQKQLLYTYYSDHSENHGDLENSIVDLFWSDLAEMKIDVSNLRNTPHYTVPQIIEYLVNNKILNEGYTLTPIFSDHFTNSAQFALGTLITERIKKDPTQIFEYWLRVCLTRELGTLVEGRTSEKVKGPSVEDYIDYCSITKLRSSRYIARISTAYIRACLGNLSDQKINNIKVSDDKGTWHGTLPLLGLSVKAKEKLPNRIDAIFGKEEGFIKAMAYLPLSGFTNHKGESRPIYSFYNLLGVLGEIVLAASSSDGANTISEVRKTIAKNSQYREYSLPSWASPLYTSDDKDGGFIDSDEPEDSLVEQMPLSFVEEITKWVTDFNKSQIIVSPSLLGKIFTRFYYSVNKMDSNNNKELGNWMHRMIVVFFNSVLLVEAMEQLQLFEEKPSGKTGKKDIIRVKLTNPTNKDDIFINNLKSINANNDSAKLVFSKWILSCPIWKLYMKQKFDCTKATDGELAFMSFIGSVLPSAKKIHSYGLCERLDDIAINIFESKGGKPTPINALDNNPKTQPSLKNVSAAKTTPHPSQKLKRFLGNLANTKEVFLEKCRNENITNEKIKAMNATEIWEFMRKHLRDVYTFQSLNKQRAARVKRKFDSDEWQL